jgi:hypothetical protein
MSPNGILGDLRRQPFEPLRFYLLDGTVYDIRHPEQCMVGMVDVIIGLAADPNAMIYRRLIRVDRRHIVRIDPIRTIPAGGNRSAAGVLTHFRTAA